LTAILTGPRPNSSTIEALGRVCRVLPVGTPLGLESEPTLRDSLAVLRPLQLPEPTDTIADPIGELSRQVAADVDPTVKAAVLLGAAQGSDAVEETLRALLTEVLPEEPEERQ
jgi:hypothetical protein